MGDKFGRVPGGGVARGSEAARQARLREMIGFAI